MADSLRATLDLALGSQYAIQRLLGRGGMGAVYLAIERSLERLVAIKVLAPEVASTSSYQERFRREARIVAQLSHPNIVPLYAFGEVDGLWYYVMGYVRGESLAERLAFEGRLPCDSVRRILGELGDALDYAHRHGIIHRDIKPANVLIDDESGRAMLADFGIAKPIDARERLSVTGIAIGTPHYMSPEQATGGVVDGRADIYSLGVLAYAMLAGHEPFDGENAQQVAFGHLTRAIPRLRDAAPETPSDLADAVTRCLAKDPTGRWSDGKALRSAIGYDESIATATPGELRDIPSFGTLSGVWALAWLAIGATSARSTAERFVCAMLAVLIPFGLLLDVVIIKRPGMRWREILRVSFWPPMWWGLWWPHALRRRGDLWDRLPAISRWTRTAITFALVGSPALLVLAHARLPAPLAEALARQPSWFAASQLTLLAMLLLTFAAVIGWGRRRGVSMLDLVRLVHGPTIVSASWTASPVKALLTPGPTHRRPESTPRTPRELSHAIAACAQSTDPNAVPGHVIVATAERLLEVIDRLDSEIRALARDADPHEIARLEARLATVGERANPSDERQEFRELLVSELALLRRLRGQHDLAVTRRAHLHEMLRRLWAQVAESDAAHSTPVPSPEHAFQRLRALIAHIDEQADGLVNPVPNESETPWS